MNMSDAHARNSASGTYLTSLPAPQEAFTVIARLHAEREAGSLRYWPRGQRRLVAVRRRSGAASDGGDGADPVCHGSPGHAGVGDEALEAVRGTRVDMEFDGHPGLG